MTPFGAASSIVSPTLMSFASAQLCSSSISRPRRISRPAVVVQAVKSVASGSSPETFSVEPLPSSTRPSSSTSEVTARTLALASSTPSVRCTRRSDERGSEPVDSLPETTRSVWP